LAGVERRRGESLDPAGPDADLIITWNPAIDGLEHPQFGAIGPFPFRRTGGHTNRGVAYVAGPGIAAGDCGQQEALHLTGAILRLLGHPQPGQTIFEPVRRAA
jgi:hypothetical protein